MNNNRIDQSGQTVEGAQVNVGRDANIGILGNQYNTYTPSIKAQAPPESCIIHYLKNVRKVLSPPDRASEGEHRLWKVGFRGRQGEHTNQVLDLGKLVDNVHLRDKKLKRLQRVVILGDTGMGKTPAMYYLRQERARLSLQYYRRYKPKLNRESFIIPIMISLADLKAGLSLLTLIRDSFNSYIDHEPDDDSITVIDNDEAFLLLKEYTCLFLFDGMEELLGNSDSSGVQIIRQFMETYNDHLYVLTCWTVAYRSQLGIIDTLFLEDLSEEEVKYVMGEAAYNQLNTSLHPLIQNRAMLSIVLKLGQSMEIIRSKGHLIREQNNKRLQKSEKDVLYLDMIAHLLEELAYAMLQVPACIFTEKQMMLFLSDYLDQWREAYNWRQIADFLFHSVGMLNRDKMRRWQFRDHLTHAFYTANSILHNPERLDTVYNSTSSTRWPEIFTLLIGLLEDPNELCYELIDRDIYIAAQCIRFSGRNVEKRVIDAVIDALIERMASETSARRRQIVMNIGESGHPRALEALLRTVQRDWSSYVVLAVVQALVLWMSRNPTTASEIVKNQLKKLSYGDLMWQAIELASGMEKVEIDVDHLMAIVDEPSHHRLNHGMAVICMGLSQSVDCRDSLLTLLKREDLDDFVAWCAAEALTLYKNSEDQKVIAEVAKKLYEQPAGDDRQRDDRRSRAVYILGWIDQESSIPNILYYALNDDDPFVRRYAINAMVRLDIRDARSQIESRLLNEKNPRVLREVAFALGSIGDINTITLLVQHLHDVQIRTRQAVKQAIQEIRDRHAMRIALDRRII